VSLALAALPAAAQPADTTAIDSLRSRISGVEHDVEDLERDVREVRSDVGSLDTRVDEVRDWLENDSGGLPLIVFVMAVFCALWAQNTGRNAWLWFFLGVFFHVITLLFLLAQNASDRRSVPPPFAPAAPPSPPAW